MIITYTPDDGDSQEYEFMPGKLMNAEAEAIEDVGGQAWSTFEEFGVKFFRGSARARRAALWIAMKRGNPRLKFSDVSFRADQVSVDYSAKERAVILEAMLADPDLDEEQRANLTTALGTELVSDVEAALDEAAVVREPDLKEPSSSSADGGSTSPPPA